MAYDPGVRGAWAKGVGVVVLLGLGYLSCAPVDAEPAAWDPPGRTELGEPTVAAVTLHLEGEGLGPEDVAVDDAGRVYTGYEDGRIVRFTPGEETLEVFATLSGGRPLGMEFDAAGRLIVADGRAGIVAVDPSGSVTTLLSEVQGEPLLFADDVDIAPDGTIWFSEASRRWSVSESTLDAIEGVPTGRLISFHPDRGEPTVHLRDLRYANGVAVTPDGQAVLVAETVGYRVTRLWIAGPKRGEVDRFVDALPGMPDNVQTDAEGRVWVALVKERSGILDALYPWPRVRTVMFRIPHAWLPVPPPIVWFAVYGPDGAHLGSYRADDGFGDVTSVTPHGTDLWLGSLSMEALGHVPRPVL